MDIYCHQEIVLHIWLRLRAQIMITEIDFIGSRIMPCIPLQISLQFSSLWCWLEFLDVMFTNDEKLGNWQKAIRLAIAWQCFRWCRRRSWPCSAPRSAPREPTRQVRKLSSQNPKFWPIFDLRPSGVAWFLPRE